MVSEHQRGGATSDQSVCCAVLAPHLMGIMLSILSSLRTTAASSSSWLIITLMTEPASAICSHLQVWLHTALFNVEAQARGYRDVIFNTPLYLHWKQTKVRTLSKMKSSTVHLLLHTYTVCSWKNRTWIMCVCVFMCRQHSPLFTGSEEEAGVIVNGSIRYARTQGPQESWFKW